MMGIKEKNREGGGGDRFGIPKRLKLKGDPFTKYK